MVSRLPDKQNGYFISFDIVDFYPSIAEKECQKELEEGVRWNIIYSKIYAFSKLCQIKKLPI